MTTPKVEGRTQLVGYAYRNGLVPSLSAGRAMDLEQLRRVVTLHREATANQPDTTATTAEKE
jgi:hypothetical protein